MSRKKKKKHNALQTSPPVVPAAPTGLPTPDAFSRQMTFDSLEDKIRGEEMIQEQEQKTVREAQDIKKKLESAEVDRRMEELKKQLGLQNGPAKKKK